LPTGFLDFVYHLLSWTFIRSVTCNTPTKIIHHNLRSLSSHEQRDTTPDTAPRTSDRCYLPIKFAHCVSSFFLAVSS
jgi:hypothetical protein